MPCGEYILMEDIASSHPEILVEWEAWLQANFDPGHHDSYKRRSSSGEYEWVCDTYLPPHLCEKIGIPHAR